MRPLLWAGGYAALFALVLGGVYRHGGPGWELASLAVMLGYPLVLLVGVADALAAREARGRIAIAPLLLLFAAVPGVAGVRAADGSLHDRSFARHLGQIEALVSRMPVESGGRMRLPADSLPAGVRSCCARLVVVRRDLEGQLSATVLGRRGTAYLYDPSGARLLYGLDRGRWRSHRRLAGDWYRVVRF